MCIEELRKIDEKLNKTYPGLFRLEKFKMETVGDKPFYVKKYLNGKKKVEFKCVTRTIICQIIKKYENKPIENIDLEFYEKNTQMMAKYLKSIFEQ